MRKRFIVIFLILLFTPFAVALAGRWALLDASYHQPSFYTPAPPTVTANDFEQVPIANNAQSNLAQIANPTPTIDTNPIIRCQSKTGTKTVPLNVCQSFTDCPDGHGGYIFESQPSCKIRWETISKQLTGAAKAYADAIMNSQSIDTTINVPLPQSPGYSISVDAPATQEQFPNLIPPEPTPMKTSTGEILDPPKF